MPKVFSIIHNATDPVEMRRIVRQAIKYAKKPKELQFIFFIERGVKGCQKMARRLYMKNIPDIFEKIVTPVIKSVKRDQDVIWYEECKSVADGSRILIVQDSKHFKGNQDWDLAEEFPKAICYPPVVEQVYA